jgi:CRISPR-associated endoribonuclease Cas6
LNDDAFRNIANALLNPDFTEFKIEHNDIKVSIVQKQIKSISEDDFMEKYYFNDADRFMRIRFCTPTSFKSQGQYIYYPDLRLIYQSLMNKYDAAADEIVYSEEVLEQLEQFSRITQYNLKSCNYHIGSVKIPAFTGQITVRVNGPQTLANFASLLFHFGEYSGVGIKAAMGMGNISIV